MSVIALPITLVTMAGTIPIDGELMMWRTPETAMRFRQYTRVRSMSALLP
ncbi:hypothetical protein [Bradyrhizobium sp. CW12]|nr:hypothetical protein [Bradyrhizobium sp. CW12]